MPEEPPVPHRRRVRYKGKNPRRFEEKYKELDPAKYPEAIAKVLASGKTPAGMHRPIMVQEILEILQPQPGMVVVDGTLGFGGHTGEILPLLRPGGRLIGLDVDPIEQPKTEARLRAQGYGEDILVVRRSNFAGLRRVLDLEGLASVDAILADLGVSSMQIDTPSRGFSLKFDGPLDMRMNPAKGVSASDFLAAAKVEELARILKENADEPRADYLAKTLAGTRAGSTRELVHLIHRCLDSLPAHEREKSTRRFFQALRIAVNAEFAALDAFLRQLPHSLGANGRVAILTFHSGEDRRVKKAFEQGLAEGVYARISLEPMRPSSLECRANSRATSAKLRWARRG